VAALIPPGFSVIDGYGDGHAVARRAGVLEYQMHLSTSIYPSHVSMRPSLGIYHTETSRLSSLFLGLTPARAASYGSGLDDVIEMRRPRSHPARLMLESRSCPTARVPFMWVFGPIAG
jgi:hypothetical protein